MSSMDGADVYRTIKDKIAGRIAITEPEAVMLYNAIRPDDLHLEIGCLWGGTAILAAHKARHVITIDFMMGGFWAHKDPVANIRPTARAVLDNLQRFGVAHKVSIVKCPSYPWPLPEDVRPDVMLIDGGHGYKSASNDWATAAKITKRTILAHDYDTRHRGVQMMVDRIAASDERWELAARAASMLMFVRRQ